MRRLQIIFRFAVAMALPAATCAQQTARPDPADAAISGPPVIYVSPLQRFQPLGDGQVNAWKASNETVRTIGGWRVYAKEAQETGSMADLPGQPSRQPAQQVQPPAHGGHSGHKMR
jgi:hypothetical protein